MHEVAPHSVRQYVDDLAQSERGRDLAALSEKAAKNFAKMFKLLVDDGFRVSSSKSLVICSHAELAKSLRAALLRRGVAINFARSSKDLGIDATGGSKRSAATANKRILKAAKKNDALQKIKCWGGKASRLFKPSVVKTAAYGIEALGVSRQNLSTLRRWQAKSLHTATGQDNICIIAIAGDGDDPLETTTLQIIDAWVKLWQKNPRLRPKIRDTWQGVIQKIVSEERFSLNSVMGPLSATVHALFRVGWRPETAYRWYNPDSEKELHISSGGSLRVVRDQLRLSVQARLAEEIGLHFCGGGGEGGIDFFQPRRKYRRLIRQGETAKAARLLTIFSGAFWPKERLYGEQPPCSRCGNHQETAAHRFWDCEANLFIQDDCIAETQGMRDRALEAKQDCPIFWCRGLLPREWLYIPPPPEETETFTYGNREAWHLGRRVFYTDASGGAHTSDPRLRRVGWATCRLRFGDGFTSDHNISCAAWGALAGAYQTVPRVELFAVIATLRLCDVGGPIVIISDCESVVKTAASEEDLLAATLSHNADLWEAYLQQRARHGGQIAIWWTAAHATPSHIELEIVSPPRFVGNAFADAIAARAAGAAALGNDVVHRVRATEKRASLIQDRLLAVLGDVLGEESAADASARKRQKRERQEQRQRKTAASAISPTEVACSHLPRLRSLGHDPELGKNQKGNPKIKCRKCFQTCSQTAWARWTSRCAPIAPLASPGIAAPDGAAALAGASRPAGVPPVIGAGGQRLHKSHVVYSCRGLLWCDKCGNYMREKPKSLMQPCAPPKAKGLSNLTRLRRSPPDPPEGVRFPEPSHIGPLQLVWREPAA